MTCFLRWPSAPAPEPGLYPSALAPEPGLDGEQMSSTDKADSAVALDPGN